MKAIQDLLPDNHCYGCGADNEKGYRIKSYFDGDVSRCRFVPGPEHCAGPPQYVYGGLIASLIDCHSVGTAIAAHYRRDGREMGDDGPAIWCVTGRLTVNYLKPTPIDLPIDLEATVPEISDKKAIIHCKTLSDETVTAEAEVIAIRVPPSWRG
ncbi:MAG: PaaI family thioesterase [Pseudomonadota bacterium]